MEPISGAIGIAGGAVTLAGLALTISKTLTNFINVHQRSALLIHSLIGACKAIEIAWNSIHGWVETQRNLDSAENSLLDQLISAIEVGNIVLGALKQDLEPYERAYIGRAVLKLKAGQKLKAVLDEGVFKDHSARLNLQVSSLHLLLATTTLPTARAQSYVCDCLRPIFRKDEETAWTIVASQAPSSQVFTLARSEAKWSDRDSFISDKSFAFTNDLLTAPVYRRLALKALRTPPRVGLVPSATAVARGPRTPETSNIYALQTGETESLVTVARAQGDVDKFPGCMNSGEKSGQDSSQQDVIAIFSSCVHCDVAAFKSHHAMENGTKLLPLHSRFRREQMTKEEEVAIDLRFVDAVKNDDMPSVGEVLDLGADINATDEHGVPALLCSFSNIAWYSSILPMFLMSYKDLNIQVRDARGRTALHTSVIMDRSTSVRFMLHRGAALENRDEDGNTPLHLAVGYKSESRRCLPEMLDHAMARSISLDSITNTAGMTALHVACLAENRHTAVHSVPLLLAAGCLPTIRATVPGYVDTVSPLYLAVANQNEFLVRKILQLPRHLVLVNRQHGRVQSLLTLAMVDPKSRVLAACGTMVLALLRAGAEYRNNEQDIYNWSSWLDGHNRSKIKEFLWQEGNWRLPNIADTNVDVQMDSPASVDSVPVEV